jgi:hypothetical protein
MYGWAPSRDSAASLMDPYVDTFLSANMQPSREFLMEDKKRFTRENGKDHACLCTLRTKSHL